MCRLVISFLLVFGLMSIIGCNKEGNNTNSITSPEQVTSTVADWMLIAGNWDDSKGKTTQTITIMPVDLSNQTGYSLVLEIDDQQLSLDHYEPLPIWTGSAELEPGHTYQFHLHATNNATNESSDFTADMKMVFPVEAQFPNPYHLNTATPITWNIAQNNQYQQVCATSTSAGDQVDEYIVQVLTSARSYTYPADCVANYGSGSDLTLEVDEFNYIQSGKLALFSASVSSASYPVLKKQSCNSNKRIMQFAQRMRQKVLVDETRF